MNKYKICCIAYKKLASLAEKAVENIADDEIEVTCLNCSHDKLKELVEAANRDGVEVFVAGGANLTVFKDTFEYPVVAIEPDFVDYLHCVIKASKISTEIAVVSYKKVPSQDLTILESLLKVKISFITFDDIQTLEQQLAECPCQAVIGASLANDIAARLGKEGVLIYPGEDAVTNAIYKAKALAEELRKNGERTQFLRAVIDYSPNGIIGIDPQGIITCYNLAAEKILHVEASRVRGEKASELFPELEMDKILAGNFKETNTIVVYKSEKLHIARLRLINRGRIISALAMLSEVASINKAEIQYINKLHEELLNKGFTAKYNFQDIIGKSRSITSVIEQAKVYAESPFNVLLLGETGSGKELFAQSIHNFSKRKGQCFVAINCAALPQELLESELFGYNEGAFTGSKKGGKKGIFELANKGTILLDEIGDIPPSLQMRLLRVLQEKEIMRVGDDKIIPIDVRVIAATNKTQRQMLSGSFRPDLLYRLNVLTLEIPPLRARGDDVILIFKQLLRKHIDDYKISIHLPEEIFEILRYYSWPGNIRELENVVRRFALFISRQLEQPSSALLKRILCNCIGEECFISDVFKQFDYTEGNPKKEIPQEMIHILKEYLGYNNDYLARLLGISRTTLWRSNK